MKTAAVASARKSLGEFKPVIVYPTGKTEVCEQSPDRFTRHTKQGIIPRNRMARGNTYATREEAIAAAQEIIDIRREHALDRLTKYSAHPDAVARITIEARLWGYEG